MNRAPRPNPSLTAGLIIAASVLVAAGIAIYESPQVRQWVDQSRRKIAIALHSLGDEIQPRRSSESSDDFEARKRRREELIRRNRNELIRRAREEGIAVDLDELAKIGREDVEMAEQRQRRKTNASQRSFDDLVGSDGRLKKEESTAQTTGKESEDANIRRRGMAGFAAGSAAGAATTNPFTDDAQVLFDHDDEEDEAPSPKPFSYIEPGSRESSATLDHPTSLSSAQLIDLTPESVYLQPENPQTASIPESSIPDNDEAAQSFYSFTSSSLENSMNTTYVPPLMEVEEAEHVSTGTLTPRSDSAFTGASVVGSHADDIAVLSLNGEDDARSEAFSESGFTEAGFSEAGFSEVGSHRQGILTPSSWTDVGSDDESEWGGPTQGQVHQ